VENEASVRGLGELLLRQNGYTVLAAADSAEADEVAARHPAKIHLLITDVILPAANGPQLAARLRIVRPGLKVLYVSGYSEGTLTRQVQLGPGMPFLQKPFGAKALMVKVREVLDS
jgi:DNA-binding NtrC family response regulator